MGDTIHNCLEKLRKHEISIEKAANECGISLWEMFDILKQEGIDLTGYSKEDAEREIIFLQQHMPFF